MSDELIGCVKMLVKLIIELFGCLQILRHLSVNLCKLHINILYDKSNECG